MKFDKSRVYTAVNADELKIGSKVIYAYTLYSLKRKVSEDCDISKIVEVCGDNDERRFRTEVRGFWPLVYLISEPELWIVYVCRHKDIKPYLTACRSDRWESIKKTNGAKTKLFEGSEEEAEEWYTSRKHLVDVIVAWEDGKDIQYLEDSTGNWNGTATPGWSTTTQYRIKPEGLKWTDLKIGDILHEKDGTETRMVTAIDTSNESDNEGDICHIGLGDWWISDEELEDWKKVE